MLSACTIAWTQPLPFNQSPRVFRAVISNVETINMITILLSLYFSGHFYWIGFPKAYNIVADQLWCLVHVFPGLKYLTALLITSIARLFNLERILSAPYGSTLLTCKYCFPSVLRGKEYSHRRYSILGGKASLLIPSCVSEHATSILYMYKDWSLLSNAVSYNNSTSAWCSSVFNTVKLQPLGND